MDVKKIGIRTESLEDVAKQIDEYVGIMNNRRDAMNNSINDLTRHFNGAAEYTSWQGKAAGQYHINWRQANDENSDFYQMREDLSHFSRYLRYAKKRYEECIQEANNLTARL